MTLKNFIRLIVFIIAFGCLGYYMVHNAQALKSVFDQFTLPLICVSILLIIISLLSKALINVILLKEFLHTHLSANKLLASYAQSQIVKYIPGKIWSIMFQASTLSDNIKKADVWIVNIYQIIIINAFSFAVIMAVFLCMESFSLIMKITILGASTLGISIIYLKREWILQKLNVDVIQFKKYAVLFKKSVVFKILILLIIDWIVYLGMWIMLSFNHLPISTAIYLAINYAASSIIGILAFFLPNGLIAREASFIVIGQYLGTHTAILLVYGVLLRFLYILGDLLLYTLTIMFERGSTHND